MKKTLVTIAAFLLGVTLGFLSADLFIHWIGSAIAGKLFTSSPVGPIAMRLPFAFGCGVLFATAFVVSHSLRQALLNLAVGIAISIGAAALYRVHYASISTSLPAGPPELYVDVNTLPRLQIPIIGAVALVCLALIRRAFLGKETSALKTEPM